LPLLKFQPSYVFKQYITLRPAVIAAAIRGAFLHISPQTHLFPQRPRPQKGVPNCNNEEQTVNCFFPSSYLTEKATRVNYKDKPHECG